MRKSAMSKPPISKKPRKRMKSETLVSKEGSVEKLFDSAVAASLDRRHDAAIEALVKILRRDPAHARARHLLGAEFAQIGKIGEAAVEMSAALELDPEMTLARFQLGLLLLTSGKLALATEVWVPLDSLGEAHVLNLFKRGMLQMAAGDFVTARTSLINAMAANNALPLLDGDLSVALRALDQAESHTLVSPPETMQTGKTLDGAATVPDETSEHTDSNHILVSTYVESSTRH
jgi:Flp pilus assembly protein TadD